MFSLFAPQCCFQDTVPLSPLGEAASTEGPHHPLIAFINTQDPLPPEPQQSVQYFSPAHFWVMIVETLLSLFT